MTALPESAAHSSSATLADRRTFPRYPAWLEAHVHASDGPTSAPGTIVDISAGGALVLTQPGFPAGGPVSLALVLSNQHFSFDGVVLFAERSWMGELLHVRFHPWPPRERLLLLKLIDDLHAGFEEHQIAIWAHGSRPRERQPRIAGALHAVSGPTSQTPARTPNRRRTRQ